MEALLQKAAAADAPERYLCIVPTERRVRWLKRCFFRWVAQQSGRASPEPGIFTLAGFLWMALGKLFPPGRYRVLSDAHRLALFEEAAQRAALSFYRRGPQESLPAALLEQLAELIAGVRRDGVDAAALEQRLQEARERRDPGVEIARLQDIVALARAYEELLGEELLDEPRGWSLLVAQLQQRGSEALRQLFPATELLLLEGFSAFRVPEARFLAALAEQSLPVVVNIDYSPENGPLFGNFQEVVEQLRGAGYRAYSTDPPVLMTHATPPSERVFLPLGAYLRRWLFNTEREIRHPGFSAVVTLVECQDREQEVVLIARLVKELLCRQGYRPHEIAVVMRQPELYSGLFREIFALYGIPANVTDRFWLAQSAVAIAVASVLSFPLNGFRRIELERIVQNPYVRLMGPGGEPLDGVNLLAVARRRRILGGHRFGGAQGWLRQLETACKFLQQQLELLRSDPYSDPVEEEELQQEVRACERAWQDFQLLCQRLAWAEERYTPVGFLRLLKQEILVGMGIYDAIQAAYEQLRRKQWRSDAEWLAVVERVERDARALTRLVELAEEFVAIFRQRWGDEPRPLADYVERFLTALRGERYQVREKPGAGVTITSIEQTRGIPFRVLILCGAVDGEFPLPYRTEHLLGYELPFSEERHRRAERMLFYQFLTNHAEALERGEQRLYITYPLRQGDQQLVRSPFIEELLKVTSLEQDGAIVKGAELLRLFHQGWDAAAEVPALVQQYGQRASWIAVQGTLSEWAALVAERGQEESGAEALSGLVRPWEPESCEEPLPLPPELEERFRQRVGVSFSATELELYRQCPYRYFALHVLRLREPEPPVLELSPLERGIVLHRIVARFFQQLQQEGELLALPHRDGLPPLRTAPLPEEFEVAYRSLQQVALEELQRIRFAHPWFELEVEQLLGTEGRAGSLWFWLQSEYRRRQERPGFVPVAVELGFGMRPVFAEPVPVAEGAWLQGRIDRVELWVEGEPPLLGVADYKSGRLQQRVSRTDLEKGFHLQLPLYLWAAQQILERDYGIAAEPAFAALYALRPHRRAGSAKAEEPEHFVLGWSKGQESVSKQVDCARDFAQEAIKRIRQRLFPVKPYRGRTFCRGCPYRALCRIDQRQPEDEQT